MSLTRVLSDHFPGLQGPVDGPLSKHIHPPCGCLLDFLTWDLYSYVPGLHPIAAG